jgi:hypothetical protein
MDMQLKLLICIVSLIVFTVVLFQFILCVRCQNCRRGNSGFLNMYKWKRQALIDTVHTGSRDGWRTVTERINFHSDHYRNGFEKLGHSDGYAQRDNQTRDQDFQLTKADVRLSLLNGKSRRPSYLSTIFNRVSRENHFLGRMKP